MSWAKAALALQINTKTKTAIPAPSPLGAPIKDASGNWVQPTQIESGALVDDELNVTRPAAMLPGPSVPTTDPYALKPYEAAKLEDNKLNRESREKAARIRASGGGGSSSNKVRTVTNSDGSKTDYDPNTGAELKHYPAKGGGGTKPADQDKARESYMKDREFIRGAQTVDELATYLTSIGAKVPARDSQEVLNAPVNQEDDHYLGVLRDVAAKAADARISGKAKQDKHPKPDKPDDESPPIAGAKKAPDGFWYVQKNGKWFKVD